MRLCFNAKCKCGHNAWSLCFVLPLFNYLCYSLLVPMVGQYAGDIIEISLESVCVCVYLWAYFSLYIVAKGWKNYVKRESWLLKAQPGFHTSNDPWKCCFNMMICTKPHQNTHTSSTEADSHFHTCPSDLRLLTWNNSNHRLTPKNSLHK